jgi:hypothetical protein
MPVRVSHSTLARIVGLPAASGPRLVPTTDEYLSSQPAMFSVWAVIRTLYGDNELFWSLFLRFRWTKSWRPLYQMSGQRPV